MAQACIYLEDSLMASLKQQALASGVSLSKLVSNALCQSASVSTWPDGFSDLYGAFSDDDFGEPAELSWSSDAPREEF